MCVLRRHSLACGVAEFSIIFVIDGKRVLGNDSCHVKGRLSADDGVTWKRAGGTLPRLRNRAAVRKEMRPPVNGKADFGGESAFRDPG